MQRQVEKYPWKVREPTQLTNYSTSYKNQNSQCNTSNSNNNFSRRHDKMSGSDFKHENSDFKPKSKFEIPQWSLLKNGSIPNSVACEYNELVDRHKSKKKVLESFFNQKIVDYNVTLNGEVVEIKNKMKNFNEVPCICKHLLKNLDNLNFQCLTAIQQATIPFSINGKDIIGCSDTGSGKTIAFLLPILNQILCGSVELNCSRDFSSLVAPYVLIMAPTRELAEQINEEARKLICGIGIHSVAIYGGVKMYDQSKKLSFGCEILVSTPGRLIDMLKQKKITLKNVKFLILDEADEMLNMGFLPQIKEVINDFDLCNKDKRQNLMFSATFEPEIRQLADTLLNEYYFVSNGTGSGNKDSDLSKSKVSKWKIKENIIQIVEPAKDQDSKVEYICNMIKKNSESSSIIFVDKKDKVDMIKSELTRLNIPATAIHGDKLQNIRQIAIDDFKKGKVKVIVSTNILARGIDFVDVDYIFNFDLPMNIEDYIHRIGRTGRLGGKGYAITFIQKEDKFKKITKDLICYIRKCGKEVPEWLGCLFPNEASISPNDWNRGRGENKFTGTKRNRSFDYEESTTDSLYRSRSRNVSVSNEKPSIDLSKDSWNKNTTSYQSKSFSKDFYQSSKDRMSNDKRNPKDPRSKEKFSSKIQTQKREREHW